ncbi:MAG: hypothetical protein E3J64_05165, partial [Anaerolineales bacterium]
MTVLAFLAAAAPSIIVALVVGGVVAALVMGWLSAKRRRVGGWGSAVGLGLLAALLVLGVIAYGQAYTPIDRGTVGLVKRFGGLVAALKLSNVKQPRP